MSLRTLLTIRSTHSSSRRIIVERSTSKTISNGFKHFSSSSASAVENKTLIYGRNLSWEQFGNGPHVALCLPGFVGSAALHFHPVIDKIKEKFTLIAWDPPGYGNSRPHDRDVLSHHSVLTDARLAGALMMARIGIRQVLLNWLQQRRPDYGALLAAAQPENIEKLIMCSSAFMSSQCNARLSKIMRAMVELECWQPKQLKETLATYEKPYLLKMLWDANKWVTHHSTNNSFNEFCSSEIKTIRAPTLYIRSTKDVVVPAEDSVEYGKLIKDFKLHKVDKGSHNHLEYLDEFVAACERFLLSEEKQAMHGEN